jgi:NDP-sugar pyrophosphorylase family protein
MDAIILAAGVGSRLGDITKHVPKPMIKLKGKPVIEHNIELCRKFGIKNIYINLHHLPKVITDYLGNGEKYNLKIHYNFESEILGTAGAIEPFLSKLNNKPFFIIYGDNFTKIDLKSLYQYHIDKLSDFTIAMHFRKDVSHSGVLECSSNGKVERFIEKPHPNETSSNWVNAGIYLVKPKIIFQMIEKSLDFGRDIIPKLVSRNCKVFGFRLDNKVIAIDTPQMLEDALEINN